MHTANIYEAKSHLSQLITEALAGEEVVIARAGKPLVRLVPYKPQKKLRSAGLWRGKVRIKKDFDKLPDEIMDAFYGRKS